MVTVLVQNTGRCSVVTVLVQNRGRCSVVTVLVQNRGRCSVVTVLVQNTGPYTLLPLPLVSNSQAVQYQRCDSSRRVPVCQVTVAVAH